MGVLIDAALVRILQELLEAILEAKMEREGKTGRYYWILDGMQSQLNSIIPIVSQLATLNKVLDGGKPDDAEKLTEDIKEGKEIVRKFSLTLAKFSLRLGCCSCFIKPVYTEELFSLERSIQTFCEIVKQFQQTTDQKEILKVVEDSPQQIRDIHEDVEGIRKETNRGKEISEHAKDIHERVNDIHDEVKQVHEEVKVNDEVVRHIEKEVRDVGKEVKQVQDICQDVKDTRFDVKDIDERVKNIHDGVKEVKQVHEEVKGTRVDVKDIRKGVKDVIMKEIPEVMKDTRTDVHMLMKQVHDQMKALRKELQRLNNTASLHPCTPPVPPKFTVGLDVPLRKLKNELFKDALSVIILTAPGGCGKTTLAEMLCWDEDIKGKFKGNIFFFTVSQKPNMKLIVDKLFRHKGLSHVPEFQSDEDAFIHLDLLLKKRGHNPLLLVLDDLSPEAEYFLDNFKFLTQGDKILVTSKSSFRRFGSTYTLQPLDEGDAMKLLVHSAVPPDQSSYIPNEKDLNKIVKSCKGNPLALTVVARSLCGQPEAVWRNIVTELSEGGSAIESSAALRNCLHQSLELLNKTAILKECYMDLGSFPEGQWIPATALIDMWAELYGLDEDGVNAIANLRDLCTRNLVNLEVRRKDANEDDGHYNDHFVLQHDLLRQLVNDQSSLEPVEQRKRLIVDLSGTDFSKQGKEPKSRHIHARLLSLITDETCSPNLPNVQAPEVEVLVLNVFTKNCTLPEFMVKMDKLKALVITNYGFLPSEITNFLLLCSLPNLRRIRLEKVSVLSLSMNSVQLKQLRKLSLVMCNIGQAFSNTTVRVSSALPNLLEINIDRCIGLENLPVWFCELAQLKKLCISSCWELSELPNEIGNLVNLEVLRLRFCIELIKLPDTIGRLSRLRTLDISDCASISQLPEQIGELHNLRKLYMKGCRIAELPHKPQITIWEPFKQSL